MGNIFLLGSLFLTCLIGTIDIMLLVTGNVILKVVLIDTIVKILFLYLIKYDDDMPWQVHVTYTVMNMFFATQLFGHMIIERCGY